MIDLFQKQFVKLLGIIPSFHNVRGVGFYQTVNTDNHVLYPLYAKDKNAFLSFKQVYSPNYRCIRTSDIKSCSLDLSWNIKAVFVCETAFDSDFRNTFWRTHQNRNFLISNFWQSENLYLEIISKNNIYLADLMLPPSLAQNFC